MTKCLKVPGHSKYRHSTKFSAPTPKHKTHSLPVNTKIMDWNPIIRFAPKIKMAARTLDEDSFFNCFEDVVSLLNVCEEGENGISRPFIERVINCLESAAKFVENVLPIVNECKGELTEVAGNLRVLFHSWCRKLTELGLRNTPNCTHLAVYLVSSPECTVNGGPGRPKYETMKRLCYTSELWDISGKTSQNFFSFRVGPCGDGYKSLVSARKLALQL